MANNRKTRHKNYKIARKEVKSSSNRPKTKLGRDIKIAKRATQLNKETTKARKAAKKKK